MAVVTRLLNLNRHDVFCPNSLVDAVKLGQADNVQLILDAGAKVDFMVPKTSAR